MTRVLLTGAAGFIGGHVAAALVDRGRRVTGLFLPGERPRDPVWSRGGARVATYAWADPAGLGPFLADAEVVLHLAGWMRGDDPAAYAAGNPGLVETLLAAPGWRPGHHLVALSSVAALGPGAPAAPPDEDATPAPVGLYGGSKRAAEARLLAADRPASRCVLRAPSVFGPGDPAFRDAFSAAARGWYPALGPRDLRFQLVDVTDLARAICRLVADAVAGRELPPILHVGNPAVLTHDAWARCFPPAGGRPVRVLPFGRLGTWAYGWWGAAKARVTGRPQLVGRDKARHLNAGHWVHDFHRFEARYPDFVFTPHPRAKARAAAAYRAEAGG